MSDIPTVTYYAYDGTRYVGQFSGEDSAVLAFISNKGYTTGPKPLASDRDLWVSIVGEATAAQEAAEAAQEAIEAELAGLDFSADDRAKIDGIEDGADVTDTDNVTAAGALMDSEVTNLDDVKAFDPSDYATSVQGGKADTAHGWGDHASAGYLTSVGWSDVSDKPAFATVATSGDYDDLSNTPTLGTASAQDVGYFATAAQGTTADNAVQPADDADTLGSGAATDGQVLTADGAGGAAWEDSGGGGGLIPISKTTITGVPSAIDIPLTGYDAYEIRFQALDFASTPDEFHMLVSDDSGSTFKTTSYRYALSSAPYTGGSIAASGSTNDSKFLLFDGLASADGLNGRLLLTAIGGGSSDMGAYWEFSGFSNNCWGGGCNTSVGGGGVNAIRFVNDSGQFISGEIHVYGYAEGDA